MLEPKKVKFRRHHRGNRRGMATRGNKVSFGSYGLKAIESSWITARQIEAARITPGWFAKLVKCGFVFSQINPSPRNQLKPGWVRVKGRRNTG